MHLSLLYIHFHFIQQQILDQPPSPIEEISEATVPATVKNITKDIGSNVEISQ